MHAADDIPARDGEELFAGGKGYAFASELFFMEDFDKGPPVVGKDVWLDADEAR